MKVLINRDKKCAMNGNDIFMGFDGIIKNASYLTVNRPCYGTFTQSVLPEEVQAFVEKRQECIVNLGNDKEEVLEIL